MSYFQKCLICNSEDLVVLKGYEKDHLFKCKYCSFVFSKKQPAYQELIDEYAKYPRSNQISEITLKRYYSLLDKFENYRKKNNIIDIGAGDGFFAGQAKLKNWNSYATEFDDKSVALCKEKGVEVYKGKLVHRIKGSSKRISYQTIKKALLCKSFYLTEEIPF